MEIDPFPEYVYIPKNLVSPSKSVSLARALPKASTKGHATEGHSSATKGHPDVARGHPTKGPPNQVVRTSKPTSSSSSSKVVATKVKDVAKVASSRVKDVAKVASSETKVASTNQEI